MSKDNNPIAELRELLEVTRAGMNKLASISAAPAVKTASVAELKEIEDAALVAATKLASIGVGKADAIPENAAHLATGHVATLKAMSQIFDHLAANGNNKQAEAPASLGSPGGPKPVNSKDRPYRPVRC